MRFELIICSGNKIQKFYTEAIAEYEKRLGRYCRISSRVCKKEKEWQQLMENALAAGEKTFLVTAGQDTVSSEGLAEQITGWESSGISKVRFLIMDNEKGICEHIPVFSLSDFMMEEGMSAMILSEQIYRAYRIIHHHPYHK